MNPRASPGQYRALVGKKPTLASHHSKQYVSCRALAAGDACPKRIHPTSFSHSPLGACVGEASPASRARSNAQCVMRYARFAATARADVLSRYPRLHFSARMAAAMKTQAIARPRSRAAAPGA